LVFFPSAFWGPQNKHFRGLYNAKLVPKWAHGLEEKAPRVQSHAEPFPWDQAEGQWIEGGGGGIFEYVLRMDVAKWARGVPIVVRGGHGNQRQLQCRKPATPNWPQHRIPRTNQHPIGMGMK